MRPFYENRKYENTIQLYASHGYNMKFLAHWHSDVEIILLLNGSLLMGVNKEKRLLLPGDIVICSSGDIHYYEKTSEDNEFYMLIFKPELVDAKKGWPLNIRFVSPFITSKSYNDYLPSYCIKELIEEIINESKHKEQQYEGIVKGKLLTLCSLLLRGLPTISAQSANEYYKSDTIRLMQKTIDYLEKNFSNEITLNDAARFSNMSPSYLSKLMKKITGLSFKDYLNSIRIENAEREILNSQDKIITIAANCGFPNIRTFNRVYKAIKGETPTVARGK